MSVLDEIRKLDEQKIKLLGDAKKEALAQAREAIAALAELGFNYQLVAGDAPAPKGKRRTGIRDEVLAKVKAHPKGVARAPLLEEMGVKGDRRGEQSVSNALAALKKAGTITAKNGVYKVA